MTQEKTILGEITKQGSKHIRRMLIQVAYAISRTKDSELKKFFLRDQEMYIEDRDKKNKRQKSLTSPSPIKMPIQEMIDYIVLAGYVVTKSDSRGGFG
jgi:transposase